MDNIQLRYFQSLNYHDPQAYLRDVSKIYSNDCFDNLSPEIRNLRTNDLKLHRERLDAAIFCLGACAITNMSVWFDSIEDQDYDFVLRLGEGENHQFVPVQLKEYVPDYLNNRSSLQGIVDKIAEKYRSSPKLTVAIKYNNASHFNPSDLVIPKNLNIKELYVFGSISKDGKQWRIWGDFINGFKKVEVTDYEIF